MDGKKARDILEGVAKAEWHLRKEIARKCDWFDPDDIAEWKRDVRRKKRSRILDDLVPDRRCPVCLEIRIGPRQWVVNSAETLCICKACHQKNIPKAGLVDVEGLFVREVRYKVNGAKIKQARIDKGLSLRGFASLAGWSGANQRRIEQEAETVTEDVQNIIVEVFTRLNGDVTK